LSTCTAIDYLRIYGCTDCTQVAWCGLRLQSISGKDPYYGFSLYLYGIPGSDMCGLKKLKGALPGAFMASSMDGLLSLDGAEGITSVGEGSGSGAGYSIYLYSNPILTSAIALANTAYPTGTLYISGNTNLQCVPSAWPATDKSGRTIPHGSCATTPAPTPASGANSGGGDGNGGGSSVGVVIGVLFGLMAVGLLGFFAYRRKDVKTRRESYHTLHESLLDNDGLEMGVAQPISHQSSSISTASNVSALEKRESENMEAAIHGYAVDAVAAAPVITMLEQVETYRIRLGFQIVVREAPGSSAKAGCMLLQGSMFDVDQKAPSTTFDNQMFLHAVGAGWVGQYHPRSGQPICERAWSTDRSEVDFDMLKHATNGFEASQEIGDGGSCTVYRATVDDIPCAIKVLAAGAAGWKAEQFAAEVNLLRRVHHPNLCRLYASSTNGPSKCLVLELMEGGALDNRLVAQPRLGWQQRVSIALDTCRGLVYLHSLSPPMIHRDVSVVARDLKLEFIYESS
jgi:hypothetical protein